jgi:hypothetical protein
VNLIRDMPFGWGFYLTLDMNDRFPDST